MLNPGANTGIISSQVRVSTNPETDFASEFLQESELLVEDFYGEQMPYLTDAGIKGPVEDDEEDLLYNRGV